jgi:hypothetical protein
MAKETLQNLEASRREAYNPIEAENVPHNWANTVCFNIPQQVKDRYPDKDFTCVAIYAGGEDLYNNYDQAIHDQWEPVTTEMYGDASRSNVMDPFGRTKTNDIKKIYGQVVMMRDKKISVSQQKHYDGLLENQEELTNTAHRPELGASSPYIVHNQRQHRGMKSK